MISEVEVGRGGRRVSIVRDGDDYVVKDPRLGVMMRAVDLNGLRRVCRWLRWDVEDFEVLPRPLDRPGQSLRSIEEQ